MILFMWLVFSGVLAAGVVATDVCSAFDQVSKDNQTTGTPVSGVIGSFIGEWGSNCTAYGEVETAAISSLSQLELQFCGFYNQLCGIGAIEACQACVASESTNYVNLVDQSVVEDVLACGDPQCPPGPCSDGLCNVQSRTMDDCATNCVNSTYKNYSSEAVTAAALLEQVDDLIAQITPYLGCQLIVKFVDYVEQPLCSTFLNGAVNIIISSAIIGVLLISFNIAMLFSIDEFDPSKGIPLDLTFDSQNPGGNSTWNKMRYGTVGFSRVTPFAVHRNAEEIFSPTAPPDSVRRTSDGRPISGIRKTGGMSIGRSFGITRFEAVSAPPVDFTMDALEASRKTNNGGSN